jgi:hypothetical protein
MKKEMNRYSESGIQLTFDIEDALREAYDFELMEFRKIYTQQLEEGSMERQKVDSRINESRQIRQILMNYRGETRFNIQEAKLIVTARNRYLRLIEDPDYVGRGFDIINSA